MNPLQFRAYLGAKFLSDCGTSIDNVILATYVLAITGRPERSACSSPCASAATVAGSAAAARLAERFPRRSLMIAADVGRAAALVLLLATPAAWHAPVIGLVAVLIGFWNGLFKVALYAEVPAFRGTAQRHGVNAAFTAAEGVAEVLGGLSAALLLAAFSYGVVFAWDAATYLVSAAALAGLHRAGAAREDAATGGPAAGPGWGALLRSVSLSLPMSSACARSRPSPPARTTWLPLLSAQYAPGNSAFLFGLIMAAWGAGRLVAIPTGPPAARGPAGDASRERRRRVFLIAMTPRSWPSSACSRPRTCRR